MIDVPGPTVRPILFSLPDLFPKTKFSCSALAGTDDKVRKRIQGREKRGEVTRVPSKQQRTEGRRKAISYGIHALSLFKKEGTHRRVVQIQEALTETAAHLC
jgi:hypothetical protein